MLHMEIRELVRPFQLAQFAGTGIKLTKPIQHQGKLGNNSRYDWSHD